MGNDSHTSYVHGKFLGAKRIPKSVEYDTCIPDYNQRIRLAEQRARDSARDNRTRGQ